MDEKIAYLEQLRVSLRKQRESGAKTLARDHDDIELARREGWMVQIAQLCLNARDAGLLATQIGVIWPKSVTRLRPVLQAMVVEGQLVSIDDPDQPARGRGGRNRKRFFHPKFAPRNT